MCSSDLESCFAFAFPASQPAASFCSPKLYSSLHGAWNETMPWPRSCSVVAQFPVSTANFSCKNQYAIDFQSREFEFIHRKSKSSALYK